MKSEKPSRGRGRPAILRAAKRLSLYLGTDELEAVRRLAEHWKCSLGEAARRAIRDANGERRRRQSKDDPA